MPPPPPAAVFVATAGDETAADDDDLVARAAVIHAQLTPPAPGQGPLFVPILPDSCDAARVVEAATEDAQVAALHLAVAATLLAVAVVKD